MALRAILAGAAVSTAAAQARTRIANVFGNNMVLQRDGSGSNVWGWAAAGDSITATFNGSALPSVVADGAGLWQVVLPPTPAGGPFDLSFTGASGSAMLTNVLFGDVILCGGQSNSALGECARRGVDCL